jgi:hypothetical protein
MTVRVLALAIMLAAGALAPLRSADAQGALFGDWRPPPPMIDSPAFALRSPLPGHPGYLETIAYIDDGLKYVDSKRAFFVSRDGRMCFVGVLNVRRTVFETRQFPWCAAPTALARIDVVENDITYVPQLRLWCRHVAPQCFQENGRFYRRANSIAVEIIPSYGEKDAVEYLVYLMGGRIPAEPP